MALTSILIAVAAILVAAIAFSMVGVGGGVIYVPILLALGMSVHDAATISLFAIVATSSSAALIYRRRSAIDWKLALVIEPSTFVMAFVGGLVANYMDATALKIVFACVLIVASFFMMRPVSEKVRAEPHGWGYWRRQMGENRYVVRLRPLMPLTTVAGFIAGLIGVSGGVFKMPSMVLAGGVPMRIAIGTSSLMVTATAIAGLSGHLTGGSFPVVVALPLAAAAFVGGRLGSSLSVRVRVPVLRLVFAIILFLIAAWMIISTLL